MKTQEAHRLIEAVVKEMPPSDFRAEVVAVLERHRDVQVAARLVDVSARVEEVLR